ncbi:PcfB family protein (plasmid) [Lactococcus petauri]|nr:PcfB family protein [Lactococcus petauri]
MGQEQQEMFRVLMRDMPQTIRQTLYLLTTLKRHVEKKKAGKDQAQIDLLKAKNVAEDLSGLEVSPEMEKEFLAKSPSERQKMLTEWGQELKRQNLAPGEKSLEFLMKTGKAIAEPQLLEKAVNLEQLKNVLKDYGLQFHIKALDDGKHEVLFLAKDANVTRNAFAQALDEISKNPEIVSSPSLTQSIKEAQKEEEKAIAAKMAEKMQERQAATQHTITSGQEEQNLGQTSSPSNSDFANLSAQEPVSDASALDLFDGGPDL